MTWRIRVLVHGDQGGRTEPARSRRALSAQALGGKFGGAAEGSIGEEVSGAQ
jgi:hypothetical protein